MLTDETAVEKLEEIISEAGAVGWNGFDEAVKKKNALDSGDRYQLYMELSDGTVISVHGYNTCPEGFEDLLKKQKSYFQIIVIINLFTQKKHCALKVQCFLV